MIGSLQSGTVPGRRPFEACPGGETLRQFARDGGDSGEFAAIEDHLTICSTCLSTYLQHCESPIIPRLPDLRVVCEIGRGRFGIVYKAWWLKDTPRLVALKILTVAGDMEVHRFDREIAVLRRIESPRIVKCLHAGESAGAHYFVMDYVRGTHLDEFLGTHTSSLSEKLKVFERVCSAVADAHASGVIHRDLKPRNILVDDTGEPHILDFGICSVHKGVGTSRRSR